MPQIALIFILLLIGPTWAKAEEKPEATLYKQPYCSCCEGHADHLRANGFNVTVVEAPNMSQIKRRHGVPQEFEGCHTIEVGGYVVEGHVPAAIIHKVLKEKPPIRGISLPGMPEGSPGMSGRKREPFVIFEIGSAAGKVFAKD